MEQKEHVSFKKEYTEPKAEIILFDQNDVITASSFPDETETIPETEKTQGSNSSPGGGWGWF